MMSYSAVLAQSPANDHLADALENKNLGTPLDTGLTTGATTESGEPSHLDLSARPQRSVWYSFKPKLSGYYYVFAQSLGGLAWSSVYTGSSISNLVLVRNNVSSALYMSAGTRYLIAVDSDVDTFVSIFIEARQVISPQWISLTQGKLEGAIADTSIGSSWRSQDTGKLSINVIQSG
jgi:hypothetical protein